MDYKAIEEFAEKFGLSAEALAELQEMVSNAYHQGREDGSNDVRDNNEVTPYDR